MKTRLWWLTAAAGAAATFLSSVASALPCFQSVGGVPGAYGQPPDWWTPTPVLGSLTESYVEDPRWQGSTAFSSVSDLARARVMIQTVGSDRFLVLAVRVKADASGDTDRLYLGFWDDTSHLGNVFSVTKQISSSSATATAGVTYASGGFTGTFYSRTSATNNTWGLNNNAGTTIPPLPDWLKNETRVDTLCPGGTCDQWDFRLRIPIKSASAAGAAADVTSDNPAGIRITPGGDFRFWYQIQSSTALNTAVLYTMPAGTGLAESELEDASTTCTSITGICFPDPLDGTTPWFQMHDGGSCVGDISLNADQIYANSPGSITVNLGAGSQPNHFHARPTNNTTSNKSGDGIRGTFRLANWGSALFDSPAWEKICTDVVGNSGTITPTSQYDIDCSYTVSDPCPYKAVGDGCGTGTKNPDQCVLVDLSAAPTSGPFFFSPQSAWQNMLFNGASTVKKVATLDTRGELALPAPQPKRDLYVYIHTQNLPEKRSPKDPPLDPKKLTGQVREQLAKLNIRLPEVGSIGKDAAAQIASAYARGALSFEEVSALMPTYAAYVFYDTGKTVDGKGGVKLKRLEPQPGFGMFLWHDGDLNGWRHKFGDSTITELAPNYYKVSAPTDGVVDVPVTVTACEKPDCSDARPPGPTTPPGTVTPPPPKHHWLWLLLFIVAVVILIVLLRPKKPKPPGPPPGP
jgi:hypothetical protein